MDSKKEIIEMNQSIDMLIAESIELIQYARQIYCKTGKFGAVDDILFIGKMDC